jgi:hypothetical protein
MDWDSIFKFFLGMASISGVFAYVGKKIVDVYLASKLESFKSTLEKSGVEHSIRFQKLHSERAEVIKELYEKLIGLDLALNSTLKAFHPVGEPQIEEKIKALSKIHNEIYYFYLPKKVFFEKSMCNLLDDLFLKCRAIFIDVTTYPPDTQNIQYKYDRSLLQDRHEFWEKARGSYQDEISTLIESLENEFRKIIGINA